jgi:hypothetical protein
MKPSETLYERQKKLEKRIARDKKLFPVLWIVFILLFLLGSPLLYRIIHRFLQHWLHY